MHILVDRVAIIYIAYPSVKRAFPPCGFEPYIGDTHERSQANKFRGQACRLHLLGIKVICMLIDGSNLYIAHVCRVSVMSNARSQNGALIDKKA